VKLPAALFFSGAVILLQPGSLAETGTDTIAGLWTFEADLVEACTFDGQARLVRRKDADVYDCELVARQDCPALELTYVVEQSCRATVDGSSVTIQSTIETFLEGPPSALYTPDHFQLTIDTPSSMSGVLFGASIHPALWRRADGAIS
jgi:hypothetical protein